MCAVYCMQHYTASLALYGIDKKKPVPTLLGCRHLGTTHLLELVHAALPVAFFPYAFQFADSPVPP